MTRPYRIEFPGAIYHVTSRGNNRQPIVSDDHDRRSFLSLLGKAAARFELEPRAFCLMDNHYHLFVCTPRPNLHLALQWLGANYTRAFNRRHGRDGHLFKGRYHAVLVDDPAHWLYLSAYIHLNPVRAHLVADPADWPWSSARDYLASRVRYEWLQPAPVLAAFGSTDAERRRRYRRHLSDLSGRPESSWDDLRASIFLGTRERWEEIKKTHPPAGRHSAVADFPTRVEVPVDFDEELARVAQAFGVKVDEIRTEGKKIRAAAYYHLVRKRGLTGARVAELFGISEMAVSIGIRRFEEKMDQIEGLKAQMERIV